MLSKSSSSDITSLFMIYDHLSMQKVRAQKKEASQIQTGRFPKHFFSES